jgi:(E)-4-hydroxy-3-methylbut-2-enyl-diphosphate synthase
LAQDTALNVISNEKVHVEYNSQILPLPIMEAQSASTQFCKSLTSYHRFQTREVKVGDVGIGGNNPIRIQSMTTTPTMDTKGTVEQSIRMIEAGCELVRITAPSIKEAENLAAIKQEIRKRGYQTPLVADIHFTPNAADVAARIVEKVRINPGNYVDKKKFEVLTYTDTEYAVELEKIRKKFIPFLGICKEYGTAIRIGTNHGSLSDRIMSKYGDTALGMVESAMEFLRMCVEEQFWNVVISMKSSNPQVMVQAYRLLVQQMQTEGMNFPLHLGVTEAGDGEDGRIKSAVGIGTLLADGIGDTIRVSLTEEPEFEIPVARKLVQQYSSLTSSIEEEKFPSFYYPYQYQKRESIELNTFIGGHQVPRIVLNLSDANLKDPFVLKSAGYVYQAGLDKYAMADQSVDFVYLGTQIPSFVMPGNLKQVFNHTTWLGLKEKINCHPYFDLKDWQQSEHICPSLNLIAINEEDLSSGLLFDLKLKGNMVLVLSSTSPNPVEGFRKIIFALEEAEIRLPIILKSTSNTSDIETFQLRHGSDLGSLFVDGFGDGIWIENPSVSKENICSTAFGVLQATRSRISKTEYISCPSCGRTLFDLQETTQRIRNQTSQLKGIKIGIMGCIVNGPGEMADADYGYVGSGPDKITLYRGQTVVKKNVPTKDAVDALIDIIKEDGNWVEKVD